MVSYHLYFPELIETLWNVNNDELSSRSFAARELIETLWNVNSFFQITLQFRNLN